MSGQDANDRLYTFGEFTLDADRGVLRRAGTDIHLRPKSLEVLRYLVEHPGRLVGKGELMDAVWGSTVVTEGSLTQCIIDIRRAMGNEGQRLLRTVPRRGFILEVPHSHASEAVQRPSTPIPRSGDSTPVPASDPGTAPASGGSTTPLLVAAALLLVTAIAWWALAGREATDPATPAAGTPPPANSIAVLRFLDLSPAGDQRYFADGLAEEVIHLLARSPALRVTARSSSFVFEPDKADISTVARQLRVAYVLEGSVRRANDDLRITAQLIDAGTNTHVWSRTYDRPFERVLELQRDVAQDVAAALKVAIAPASVAKSTEAAQAQDLFLLGRYLFHRQTTGDLEAAERHLEQAVKLDPSHARAWTALAGAYAARGLGELGDSSYRLEDQRRALEHALALDPELAEALVRLSRYYWIVNRPADARATLEQAYSLAPDDPLVLWSRSSRAILDGRPDDAVALQRRAIERDPLSAIYRGNLALTLLGAGKPREALVELRRARDLAPRQALDFDISRALLLMGRMDEARDASMDVAEGPRRDQLRILLAEPPAGAEVRERLQSDPSARSRLLLAEIAALEKDPDAAFAWLEEAVQRMQAAGDDVTEFTAAVEVRLSPFLRPLHDDPRWERLLAQLPIS